MKQIKNKLKDEQLSDIHRAGAMLCIGFGGFRLNDKGKSVPASSFHIQCPFRFILHNNIIVASYDMRIQKDLDDKMNNTKFDKFLKEKVLPMLPTKILDLNINSLGDIHIKFSNDLVFETFIDSRADVEHWRLSDETKDFKEDLIFVKDENEFAEKSNNYLWLESHMLRNLY